MEFAIALTFIILVAMVSSAGADNRDEVKPMKRQLRSGHTASETVYQSEGNIHDQLGIKEDAKFVAYNGNELTTNEALLKAFKDSKEVGRHSLQIEQDGKLRTLKYEVRK
jgi:hypothetical protein